MMSEYGTIDLNKKGLSQDAKDIIEKGYVVLKGVLSDKVEGLLNSSFRLLEKQESNHTIEELEKIYERDMLRAPLIEDRKFLDYVLMNPEILRVVKELLGPNIQIHLQNVIFNNPKRSHNQSKWHRDIPYQPFIPSWPFSISVLVALTDFSEKTGGTRLIEASHRDPEMPRKDFVTANLQPGDALVFDSFLWHCSGKNSSDEIRVGINNMYTTPIIRQQINLCDHFLDLPSPSIELQKLLGLFWREPSSVKELRDKKLRR